MDYKTILESVSSDSPFEFIHDGPIKRGATQTHSFKIPDTITDIKVIYIIYSQKGTPVIISELNDNAITLTEADTFKFKANVETTVQLKVCSSTNGYTLSPIFNIDVEQGLDDMPKTYDDDFYAIEVSVIGQNIRAVSYLSEAINNTYLRCKFKFDNTWAGKQKVVYFKDEYNHLIKTSLAYDWCLIPAEILMNPGIINVGVYSDVSRSTIWSNNIVVSMISISKHDATECDSPQPATATRAGLVKLFDDVNGQSIEGAVTQRCVAAQLARQNEQIDANTTFINTLEETIMTLRTTLEEFDTRLTNLNSDLQNEKTIRDKADKDLNTTLSNLEKLIPEDLSGKLSDLEKRIQDEVNSREKADNTHSIDIENLKNNLKIEASLRASTDDILKTKVENQFKVINDIRQRIEKLENK